MTGRSGPSAAAAIRAITFDFGNTLCPVRREDLARTVLETAERMSEHSGPFGAAVFHEVWAEERARQLAFDVPALREMDLTIRIVRVLARLRGMAAPAMGEPWNDEVAAGFSDPGEIAFAARAYSEAFVRAIPPAPGVGPLLQRLSGRHRLGIVSNWPLAAAIDAYLDAAGWRPFLAAVIVSERVGVIKPHPRIFAAAEHQLGVSSAEILHVGDDWAADVVGGRRAGWHVGYLRNRPEGSPLPDSTRDDSVKPDLEIGSLEELEPALELFEERFSAGLV